MIAYKLILSVCLVSICHGLRCNKCTNLLLENSFFNTPDINTGCTEVECGSGETCFGMRASVTALGIKGNLDTKGCMAGSQDTMGSPVPVCEKADLNLANKLLKIALPAGVDMQVDGYMCRCGTDLCDSTCEDGYVIGDKFCISKLMIGGISAGIGILFLLCITCCCCCCCCRRTRPIVSHIAANPLLIVNVDQSNGEAPATYWQGNNPPNYTTNSLPRYDYVSNADDVSLIKA